MKTSLSRHLHPVRVVALCGTAGRWIGRGIVKGFGGIRVYRYIALGLGGVVVIWALAMAYLFLSPQTYQSGFTLILPGSGAGTSVNLDSIGQASSLSESPFANHRVNPTESYKRLLMSDRVRDAAAEIAGTEGFQLPRIKLLDQTQFMEITVSASSPEEAFKLAQSLEQAFLREVGKLRREERLERERSYTAMIEEFEEAVSDARSDLLAHQSASGLASLDQFSLNVEMADRLKAEYEESRVRVAELQRRRDEMLATVGLQPESARIVLVFSADPVFMTLLDEYARTVGEMAAQSYKFGENHPEQRRLTREHDSIRQYIAQYGQRKGTDVSPVMQELIRINGESGYATLLLKALEAHTDLLAAQSRAEAIGERLSRERARIDALSADAARLDDLHRAYQVAEAVFRSAVARIETNKTDLFASYPLIQTVEAPYTPETPASPLPMLAIGSAVIASLFFIMGLCLACLRLPVINLLLKRD